jgi:hypothetical protein
MYSPEFTQFQNTSATDAAVEFVPLQSVSATAAWRIFLSTVCSKAFTSVEENETKGEPSAATAVPAPLGLTTGLYCRRERGVRKGGRGDGMHEEVQIATLGAAAMARRCARRGEALGWGGMGSGGGWGGVGWGGVGW